MAVEPEMQSRLTEEEVVRLNALFNCHVLDTPPEELFDRTTRLAAYLCGTAIGLIGFIDASRQWFKSRVGWDYPEIPREDSFCEQTGSLVITEYEKAGTCSLYVAQ